MSRSPIRKSSKPIRSECSHNSPHISRNCLTKTEILSPFTDCGVPTSPFQTRDELLTLRQKHSRLKLDFEYNVKLLEERDKELDKFDQMFVDKNNEIRNLNEKVVEHQKHLEGLQGKFDELSNEYSALGSRVSERELQTSQKQQEIYILNQNLVRERQEINKLNEELLLERQKFRDSTLATEQKLESILKQQQSQYQERLLQYQETFDNQKRLLEEQAQNDVEEDGRLRQEIRNLKNESSKLTSTLQGKDLQIAKSETEKRRLDTLCTSYDSKFERQAELIQKLKKEMDSSENRSIDFENELSRSRESWNKMEEQWQIQIINLKKQRDELIAEIERERQNYQHLEQSQISSTHQMNELNTNLQRRVEELNNLRLSETQLKHEVKRAEIDRKQEMHELFQQEKCKIEKLQRNHKKETVELNQKILDQKQKVIQFEEENSEQKILFNHQSEQLSSVDIDLQKQKLISKQLSQQIADERSHNEKLNEHNGKLIQQLTENRNNSEHLQAIIQKLTNECKQMKSEMIPKVENEELTKKFSTTQNELEKYKGLDNRLYHTLSHVKTLETRLNDLQIHYDQSRQKNLTFEQLIQYKQKELNVNLKKKKDLKQMVSILRGEVEELTKSGDERTRIADIYEDIAVYCRDVVDENQWLIDELWDLINQKAKFFKTNSNKGRIAPYKPSVGWLSIKMTRLHFVRDKIEEIDSNLSKQFLISKLSKLKKKDEDLLQNCRRKINEVRNRLRLSKQQRDSVSFLK